MTKPVYKIETWTGANKDHTIGEGGQYDALGVYTKEILTSGIGHFSFTVPTKKNGSSYYYDDIALGDKVKIWFGYDSISGNPDFIGKVGRISAPFSAQSGYLRTISGLSQGEILLRRLKKKTLWESTGASTIITTLATDLSLGVGDIEADATSLDLKVETETYFDLIKRISDWYDVGGSIQKDFYVDVDNDLVWCARDGTAPFRSGANVETLTVGDNIIVYQVIHPVDPYVKNDIEVFGVAERPWSGSVAKDGWTQAITNWSSDGALSTNADSRVGTVSVQALRADAGVYAERTISAVSALYEKEYKQFRFWVKVIRASGNLIPTFSVRLYDDAAYFFKEWFEPFEDSVWTEFHVPLGANGDWSILGAPDWDDIDKIYFDAVAVGASDTFTMRLDGVHFYGARYEGSASDAASQASYGQRDLEVIDNRLRSDSECDQRAETLLLQKKNPPTQIVVTTPGNTNILIGDRLSMTIPAEGISAANYDVFTVEHSFSNQGFLTTATMVNTANIRESVETNLVGSLINVKKQIRELSKDEKRIA